MNLERILRDDALRDRLASEFVLGTLRGGARRRFEAWLHADSRLQHTVAAWQDRLHPMAELVPPAQPGAAVWRQIEGRLGLNARAPASRRSFWISLREDLGFWRGLGMASTAAAAILVAVLLTRVPDTGTPLTSYVATLADENAQPTMVVTGDARRNRLTIKVLARRQLDADKSLELWAIPKDGPPRSLGLVPSGGTVTLPLPQDASPATVVALAISLEPKGGSPNPNAPSGPVIYKGAWVQI